MNPNLTFALDNKEIVTAVITKEVTFNRLQCYTEDSQLPQYFIASPLGPMDKSDGSNRRIHHSRITEAISAFRNSEKDPGLSNETLRMLFAMFGWLRFIHHSSDSNGIDGIMLNHFFHLVCRWPLSSSTYLQRIFIGYSPQNLRMRE